MNKKLNPIERFLLNLDQQQAFESLIEGTFSLLVLTILSSSSLLMPVPGSFETAVQLLVMYFFFGSFLTFGEFDSV